MEDLKQRVAVFERRIDTIYKIKDSYTLALQAGENTNVWAVFNTWQNLIEDQQKAIQELTEREAKLVETLEWYANSDNYDEDCAPFVWDTSFECVHEFMTRDMGKKAQTTLKDLGINTTNGDV